MNGTVNHHCEDRMTWQKKNPREETMQKSYPTGKMVNGDENKGKTFHSQESEEENMKSHFVHSFSHSSLLL